ncbi:MAG TPA: ThuA domain-containing protein [Candidatus Angelobacter sp.]|nr:ThuA domain-containing protein [Candidatus Angelobacter sp.]
MATSLQLRKKRRSKAPLCVLATIVVAGQLSGVEPWSDAGLPVKEGLVLWLDATRENEARQALGLPMLFDGAAVDIWHDGSGRVHHVEQQVRSFRPRFKLGTAGPAIRFDGQDDYLSASIAGPGLTNATLVLFASPHSNAGGFRGFLAMNETGRNDYQTGLTIDLGPTASARFETLNPEGSGFGGAINAMTDAFPFATFHTVSLTTEPGPQGTQLYIDGVPQHARSRASSSLRTDQLTVGARSYSNEAEPPFVQGFLDGDIDEALLYDRVLGSVERAKVEAYLARKHAARDSDSRKTRPLVTVTNPPPVQVLVPGFTVSELPLRLNNINNLKYRGDGKLFALGYNGRIFLLSDTDGNGLEDRAGLFWDKPTLRAPIGMALTPPGYARGNGVFVAAKGKVSLIVDTNRDDVADQEIIVADGWEELHHGVDALGIAVDRDGSVYFGLGAADYTNPYLIDRDSGRARYDLKSERGTILKVTPDFTKREIVCTGVRFSVGMAFNRAGDLFCTDQEGATWLPNGNPFDELLQIQPARHYGFPPRHPRFLPDVIDEPSVFDYGPQHQSTCGLNFNERVNGGPTFGPEWWAGDAIVSGYSRGKLWHTKLAKTAAGYVAETQLFACLNALTVDASVSPAGDLLVSTHSGGPDWGSGPDGKGRLYRIHYSDKDAPQPVLAWAASPTESRIEFDRPLDPAQLKNLVTQITFTQGKYVSAGDRFETLRPGYQAVQNQLAAPRYDIPVLAVNVTPDRRVLIVTTSSRTEAVRYAVTLPRFGTGLSPPGAEPAQTDLLIEPAGADAQWESGDRQQTWSGWLPHLDFVAARAFTVASPTHDRLWELMSRAGELKLRAQLDLWQMLRPAIQPGSVLDYALPDERVTVVFRAASPLSVKTPAGLINAKRAASGSYEAVIEHSPKEGQWLPLEITLATGNTSPQLEVAYHTTEDARPRALPVRRILLPWTTVKPDDTRDGRERQIPELAGGNWPEGRRIFFGDTVACHKCHRVRDEGGTIGPDLSNLVHRDYESVLRDIRQPSAAINPDHIAYAIQLTNGETINGVLQGDDREKVVVGLVTGQPVTIYKKQIVSANPSPVSLMPEGLDRALSAQQMKDLLTFLLTAPLETAQVEAPNPPAPRSRVEVGAVLKQVADAGRDTTKPLHILLVAGPKDHGPGEHDYPLWQKRWHKLLALADKITVDDAFGWPAPGQFHGADLVVFYSDNPGWSAARAQELDEFLGRGGGLAFLHYAVDGHEAVEALSQRIGLAWRGGQSRFRHGPLQLQLSPDPLTSGFDNFQLVDESYWNLVGDEKNVRVLARGVEENAARPLAWTREQGPGRVFVCIPGHFTWTFDDPLFRLLVFRGMMWSAHQPMDRLAELALIGARVEN